MTAPTIKSLLDKVERVNINTLRHHPSNPRIGNVDLVAKSLDGHSQYKPLVVQKSGKTVLAGNHTLKAARKLGWTQIDVVFVDVDDDKAKEIMLMDNKSSDEGGYDQALLAEVLQSLEDTSLTGYSTDEIGSILDSVNFAAADGMGSTEETARRQVFDDAPLGEEDAAVDEFNELTSDGADPTADEFDDTEESATPGIDEQSDELAGPYNFKPPEEVNFKASGYWGVPDLLPDKLMRWEDLPEKLYCWAESFSRNKIDPAAQDDETWWFFNWGMSSSSGMENLSQVIVAFYSFDHLFENWWSYPDRYATKLVNSKIKYIVTPDFSQFADDARVMNLWNLYRSRWIGRYMQECGIKVLPHVDWPVGNLEYAQKHVWATLPVGLPMIATQFQTDFNPKDMGEALGVPEKQALTTLADHYLQMFDYLKPKAFLLYAGKPGQDFYAAHLKDAVENDRGIKVRVLDSRLMRINQFQGPRQKKKTI